MKFNFFNGDLQRQNQSLIRLFFVVLAYISIKKSASCRFTQIKLFQRD